LTDGIPDEPDTGGVGLHLRGAFDRRVLCHAVSGQWRHEPPPDLTNTTETEDKETSVRMGWYGDQTFGAEETVFVILESSNVRCALPLGALTGYRG
jgi:hypothetical protein